MKTRMGCPKAAAHRGRRASVAGLTVAAFCLLLGNAGHAQTRPARAVQAALMLPLPPLPPLPPVMQASQKAGAPIWLAASDRTLDQMRGGFDLGAGLMVSFGISRAVYSNGELITSTTFRVSDLNHLTATQATALSQQISAHAQWVSRGGGNTVELGTGTAPMATFIQNTLNNQTLRNHTVINAASNSMGLVKDRNLQATIDQAIANAIGNR